MRFKKQRMSGLDHEENMVLTLDVGKHFSRHSVFHVEDPLHDGKAAFQSLNQPTVIVFVVVLICFAKGNALAGSVHTAWHKMESAHIPDNNSLLSCVEEAVFSWMFRAPSFS